MEETDEDLFGSLEGLPSIDTIEEEIIDTSIDEETSVAETNLVNFLSIHQKLLTPKEF